MSSKIKGYESIEDENALLEQDVEDKKSRNARKELNLRLKPQYIELEEDDSSVADSSDVDSDDDIQNSKKIQSGSKPVSNVDNDNDDDMFDSDDDKKGTSYHKSLTEKPSTFLDNFHQDMKDEINSDIEDEHLSGTQDEDEGADDYSYFDDQESLNSAGRVRKVGLKVEPFNLNNESESGLFDENGNFLRKEVDSEEEKIKDSWYSEHSKRSEIEKTRKAQEERESELREKQKEQAVRSIEDLLTSMISFLEPLETAMERLLSLNKSRPKTKKQKLLLNKVEEEKTKKEIEDITSIANELMANGVMGIYDLEREELMRLYKKETGRDFLINRGSKRKHTDDQFEFQYLGDEAVHGPYSKEEILEWKTSYFDENVLVRLVGDDHFENINDYPFEV